MTREDVAKLIRIFLSTPSARRATHGAFSYLRKDL